MDVAASSLTASPSAVLEAVGRKCRESAEVKERFFREQAPRIAALCRLMADAFERGHRLFVMGNGGSACDAQHVAVEFAHPVLEKRRALPALALSADPALMTAIGNDTDFSRIFSDQIKLLGRKGDMALGISTSGHAPNVLAALRAAQDLGMLTIGFTGMDGGRLAEVAEHCFVVPSFSIHRIQETHVVLLHVVWDLIHVAMGEEDVL